MNRPRVPLGLESTRATLDRQACAEAGAALVEARLARGLTIHDVGAKLLLSPAQVAALEQVRPDAFYGAEFYAAALKKYATFLDVDTAALARVRIDPRSGDGSGQPSRRRAPAWPHVASAIPRPRNAFAVALGIVITTFAGWLLFSSIVTRPFRALDRRTQASRQPQKPAEPTTIQLTPTESVKPAPVTAEAAEPAAASILRPLSAVAGTWAPVTAMAASASDVGLGHIKVARDTWIFVRYENNSTVERRLTAGGEFVLSGRPVYLAIGESEGTEVVVAGQVIENARFTNKGQLRIGSAYLATLAAARQ